MKNIQRSQQLHILLYELYSITQTADKKAGFNEMRTSAKQ